MPPPTTTAGQHPAAEVEAKDKRRRVRQSLVIELGHTSELVLGEYRPQVGRRQRHGIRRVHPAAVPFVDNSDPAVVFGLRNRSV